MSVSCKDLKNKKYLEPTKSSLESRLGIRFIHSTAAHCPFYDDARDSFRLRISKENEIRFHCFGACEKTWDIDDLIMLKKKGNRGAHTRNRCARTHGQAQRGIVGGG
jgi:DNA primase